MIPGNDSAAYLVSTHIMHQYNLIQIPWVRACARRGGGGVVGVGIIV